MIVVSAPAKVNLYLHVVGKRNDGYHLLDSLFAFTRDGDEIAVENGDGLTLTVTDPALSAGEDNIVMKAARKLAAALNVEPKAAITLRKNLPVASGIGGGSSDAAATLEALQRLWGKRLDPAALHALAAELGADVPACLEKRAVAVSGIGEILTPAPALPPFAVLLVNPNKPVSTPAVFKSRAPVFSEKAPMPPEAFADRGAFVRELEKRHNDLQDAACRIEPAVRDVLNALKRLDGALFSAMSGSGGTCFALFPAETDARKAAAEIAAGHAGWWVKPSVLI